MSNVIGRIIGFGVQAVALLLIVNDHPNPLEYQPFFGSFGAEKIGGFLIGLVGVLVYRFFGGRYTLITEGFQK